MTARDRITSLVSFEVQQKFILSPFHKFGVFPDRIQHAVSSQLASQHGDSSCQPNFTPANVDNPALSLISRGSLSLVLCFAFRCPK